MGVCAKYTIKIVINEFSTGIAGTPRISGSFSYFTVGLSAGQNGLRVRWPKARTSDVLHRSIYLIGSGGARYDDQ
jgi:hypothetical protein